MISWCIIDIWMKSRCLKVHQTNKSLASQKSDIIIQYWWWVIANDIESHYTQMINSSYSYFRRKRHSSPSFWTAWKWNTIQLNWNEGNCHWNMQQHIYVAIVRMGQMIAMTYKTCMYSIFKYAIIINGYWDISSFIFFTIWNIHIQLH